MFGYPPNEPGDEEGGDQQHLVGGELTSQVLPLICPDPPEGPGL